MNARLITVAVIGALLGATAGFALLPSSREKILSVPRQVSVGTAQGGGPFALVDQTGRSVTDETFRGRPMLVLFGFTNCPDVCPTELQLVSAALDKLGPRADRLTTLFITLDPERDTPARLAEYVKSFNPRILGLTGTAEQVANAAKAYRVYFKKVADEKAPDGYTIDHSAIIYLMDANGAFLTHVAYTTSVDRLLAQLDKVL